MRRDAAFVLEEFEQSVYRRDYEKSVRLLLVALSLFESGQGLSGGTPADLSASPGAMSDIYTRLASGITALFASDDMRLSPTGFDMLALQHRNLHEILRTGGFENADHLFKLICNDISGKQLRIDLKDRQKLLKVLICLSLHSKIAGDFSSYLKKAPSEAFKVYLGMFPYEAVLDPAAYAAREAMLKMGHLIENIPLPDIFLPRLINLWMLSSYSDSHDKHEIKRHLNVVLQKWLAGKGISPVACNPAKKSERPVIMVIAEYFNSVHAVYRCFSLAVEQLRPHFKLILLAEKDKFDNKSASMFDEVITVAWSPDNMPKIVETIRNTAPDMIYYPSVGMLVLTTALANLRLAPIQFATLGHPATTMSPHIDYFLVGSNHYGGGDVFSEKLIALSAPFPMTIRHDSNISADASKKENDVLNIAVTGTTYKLNPSFIALCKRLYHRAAKKIEFHFFALNAFGLRHQMLCREIRNWLPDACVYAFADYNTYMSRLKTCDIFLGTFPFGGTNSALDCMMLGIPGIAYEGTEPHARLDSRIARLFGLPEWTITASLKEYEEAAARLITNDIERHALSDLLKKMNIDDLMRRERDAFGTEFLDAVNFVYEYDGVIREDGRKVWMPEMRKELQTKK